MIISSGFAEEGGDSAAMQDAIADLARRTGMRISGPNAEGFYSEVQHVAATFSPTVDVKPDAPRLIATARRIGIVAQSGGIGFAIYHRARALGIALSYVVSAGNESDLGAGEFLDYMVQDGSTDVILLFIEGIRDVDKFLAAARLAAEAGKPVIVTKVGRSGAGERAAASHTASMAGWSAAYDAVFAKYGFIVSNDLDEAVTIAALLTSNPMPQGDRVAVLTVSGGAGIWGADTVSMQGLQVPELSEPIQAEIRSSDSVLWFGAQPDRCHRARRAQRRVAEEHRSAQRFRRGGCRAGGAVAVQRHQDAVQAGRTEAGDVAQSKPIVFYSYTLPSPFARVELAASGVVVLSGLTHVGVAMRQMVQRAKFRLAPPAEAPASAPRDISAYLTSATLSESDSKSLLRDAGIALPDEVLVTEKTALDAAIARVGFPLVMKIQSRDIPHKSEVGGVRVNIATKGEAFAAYQMLLDSARRHRPSAAIQGVLVGPMAEKGRRDHRRHPAGRHLRPDGHGRPRRHHHRIVQGRDLPAGAGERGRGRRHAGRTEGGAIARRFRGAAKTDIPALSQLISQISLLAARCREQISEIELNPVLVHPEGHGVTIVDALVVGKKS